MLSKVKTSDCNEKLDLTVKRRIVRIKRTKVSIREKSTKMRINTMDGSLGFTFAPNEVATDILIARTLSFDNENVYNKFSGGNSRHPIRLVWNEKRKAGKDNDSARLSGSPRKRAKLDEGEMIHSNDHENKSDTAKSNFKPDFGLIISWV